MAPPAARAQPPAPRRATGARPSRHATAGSTARQRGLSLVELMVALAAGLAVLAGAAALTSAQLADRRHLLLEARVQQDLRAALDIVVRDLRRAGAWNDAVQGLAGPAAAARPNPYSVVLTTTAPQPQVRHAWDRGPGLAHAQGFRLAEGALQTLVGTGWQALTDPQALHVTAFAVVPLPQPSARVPCPRACADGSQDCWPRLTRRVYTVELAGHPPAMPAMRRQLSTTVMLRNDLVEGACP